ncbi:cadherin-like domain-containing protein [Pusillimonas sp.]|uniref:cadherin-like domain-containing protein n=1 Tax=Pusillimonas sp. TaxID=3040095 RepID=UPI0037CB86A8
MTKLAGSRPSPRSSEAKKAFAPRNSRLALETRILFDGAAAVAGADAFDGDTGDVPEYVPQSQDDQQDAVVQSLFGAMSVGVMSAGDVSVSVDGSADELSVAEPISQVDGTVNIDTVNVDGWKLSGEGTVTVTVSLDNEAAGSLKAGESIATEYTGTAAEVEQWLNSLVFTPADVELGNDALTVVVTATLNGDSDATATRTITITPSNDPATLADATVTVTEGDTYEFSATDIEPVDPEVVIGTQDSSQLIYSLQTGPTHGYLTLNNVRLGEGSIFTQEDIEQGKLRYVHTAGGTDQQNAQDSFTLRINDGATPIGESDTAVITLDIDPVNQPPSIGGSGVVYEGQPRNAQGTGNVGQYIIGSTGGDPGDDLENSVVRITSLPGGGKLYFTGTFTNDEGVSQTVVEKEITAADITAGFTFLYSEKDGLSYERTGGIIGDEGATSDSFGVSITDQGGGTDTHVTQSGIVDLTVLPIDDDPILDPAATLEAAVPDAANEAGHAVVLTPEMIGASDVDTNNRNIRFIVDYDSTVLSHGHLQLWIAEEGGTENGGTWYNLPAGESVSMYEIDKGRVRYVQTTNASEGDVDTFRFKVVDSTNAMRWDTDGSIYERIGGIYDYPADKNSPLKDHDFTIKLTNHMPSNDGRNWDGLVRNPQNEDSTHAGHKPGDSSGNGELVEGGFVILGGTDHEGDDPYLSYEAKGVEPEDVVYTFGGFSNEGGSSSQAGELQIKIGEDNWRTLNHYDSFTQADLNDGKIRFKHDGDSEKFASTALFTVSAGVMVRAGDTWEQSTWNPEFIFYITPTNDLPVVTGSDGLVIKEGETVYITDQWLGVSDPDDAASNSELWGSEGGDGSTGTVLDKDEVLRDGVDNFAVDHDDDNPLLIEITGLTGTGAWEYWDADANDGEGAWVELQVGDTLDSNLLKTASDGGASGLRFVHNGSEDRSASITVKAIDRWNGESEEEATVNIQITNVNDGPLIAQTPDLDDPYAPDVYNGSDSNIGLNQSANNPVTVHEGQKVAITKAELQAIDSDSTSRQVQYKITQATKYGDILLSGKKLGVGSSFTQADVDAGLVTYVHRGRDVAETSESYNDHFKFTLSDGDQEQTGNEFWIRVTPANDPPTVAVPSVPQKTGDDGVNKIVGVSVGDTDWTIAGGATQLDRGEENFIQVTVRLIDDSGETPVVVPGSEFVYDFTTPGSVDGNWGFKNNVDENGLLVLQGTREQVNAALAGLTVAFNTDKNAIYTLEVIADDRLRDSDGDLTAGANGGGVNQGTAPGDDPVDILDTEYDWSSATTTVAGLEAASRGNIVSRTVELWSSRTNDAPELEAPAAASVYEDVRTRIEFDPDGEDSFKVYDKESEAFDTEVQLFIQAGVGQGALHIGESGSTLNFSITPIDSSSDDSDYVPRSVSVQGNGSGLLILTGRASDIQALLNDSHKANGMFTGGLFYTSPADANHDMNEGANGDVTLTFTLTDAAPEGEDNGSDLGIPPAGGNASITHELAVTIIPVNDAPTVDAGPDGSEQDSLIRVAGSGAVPIDGIVIGDVDGDNDYVTEAGLEENEEDGTIQVIVRLLDVARDESGAPIVVDGKYVPADAWSLDRYAELGVEFLSLNEATSGAEALRPGAGANGVSTGASAYDPDVAHSALILRGTLAEINAYLAGLQVAFTEAENANVDQHLLLEIIVDDRIRDTDGSLKRVTVGEDNNIVQANGGTQNQPNGDDLGAIPDTDNFQVYSVVAGEDTTPGTAVSGDEGYNVFNVVSDTRELFVSSINDPAFIRGDIEQAAENDQGTVTLTGLTITDSDALPNDKLTITVSLPQDGDFTIHSVGGTGGDLADGFVANESKTVTLTGTLAEINSRLNQIVINLPDDTDGLPAEHWHGSFKVVIEVNDNGNQGTRPAEDAFEDYEYPDDIEEGQDVGDFGFAYPDDPENPINNALITTRELTFIVNPVNDKPVLVNPDTEGAADADVEMSVKEDMDTAANNGETVANLFGDRFSDANDDLIEVDNDDPTDDEAASEPDTFWGVIVVGDESIEGQGTWEYKLPDGDWTVINLGANGALVLAADASIRFNPKPDFHGDPGKLTVRLIETNDNDDDTTTDPDLVVSGKFIDDQGSIDFDDTSRFSDPLDLVIEVENVNDAPSLTGEATLADAEEDVEHSAAMTAGQIAGQLTYSDATDDVSLDAEEGGVAGGEDASTDLTAIAIVGNAADPANEGTWYYTLNGADWIAVPVDVGNGNAIVLDVSDSDHQIRFVPVENYNGTPGGLTVRGADETWNEQVGVQDISSVLGDTHPWSADSGTVGIVITPVNDRPTLSSSNQDAEDGGRINITVIEKDDLTEDEPAFEPVALLAGVTVGDPDLGTGDIAADIFGAGSITVAFEHWITGDEIVFDPDNAAYAAAVERVEYDSASGELVITLTEAATREQVEKILEAITFTHNSDDPTNILSGTPRTTVNFTVELDDGDNEQAGGNSGGPDPLKAEITGSITITAVNDAPDAVDDEHEMLNTHAEVKGNVIAGNRLQPDSSASDAGYGNQGKDGDVDNVDSDLEVTGIQRADADGNPTGAKIDFGTEDSVEIEGVYGTLTIFKDGSYAYVLDADKPEVYGLDDGASLVERFEYTLSDGVEGAAEGTDTALLVITITGDTPVLTIVPRDDNGADDPGNAASTGHATVYESGLGTVDATGSEAATDKEFHENGEIKVNISTGLKTLEIGSGEDAKTFTLAELQGATPASPLVVDTAYGVLRITNVDFDKGDDTAPQEITLTYTYELTKTGNNAPEGLDEGLGDNITLRAVDVNDKGTSGILRVYIVDDAPTAVADTNAIAEDGASVGGNVMTGGSTGDAEDTEGADGATLTGVMKGGLPTGQEHVSDTVLTSPIVGDYGSLTIGADGAYTYTLDNTNLAVQGLSEGQTLTEIFTYTITDGDGDQSTTTLTITITGTDDDVTVTVPEDHDATTPDGNVTDHVVFESALPGGTTAGSPDSADDLRVESSFTVEALDGLDDTAAIQITYVTGLDGAGDPITATETISRTVLEGLTETSSVAITTQYGELVLHSYEQKPSGDPDYGLITIGYTYTLTTAPEVGGVDTMDTFTIVAQDKDADSGKDSDTKTLNIKIVDDAPIARADENEIAEGAASVGGNVMIGTPDGGDGDTKGADGAEVTGFQFGTLTAPAEHVAVGGVDTDIAGSYGGITIDKDGNYTYTLDNTNLAVQGLSAGETLTETFTYTITDGDGDQSTTTLTITITGTDDDVTVTVPEDHDATTPDGNVTDHVVFESALPGGTTAGSPDSADDLRVESSFTIVALDGVDPTEAVAIVYTDKDGNSATRTLTQLELEGLSTTSVMLTTQYGTLVLNGFSQNTDPSSPANGTITVGYTYTLTTAPDVDGDDTSDAFTIVAQDKDAAPGKDSDTKTLNIKIVDDAPKARNDDAEIHRGVTPPPPDGGIVNQATGNVYTNDTIGADGASASGPVTGVAPREPGAALDDVVVPGSIDSNVTGKFGTLVLDANGDYTYVLNVTNTTVADLLGGESIVDTFHYTITDADGDTHTAELKITIWGNTPPGAQPDIRVTPEDTPVSGNVITGEGDGDQADGDGDLDDVTLTKIEVDTNGDGTPETYTVPTDPATPLEVTIEGKGKLTIGSDGSYTFVPVPDWHGEVPDITYTIHDGVDREDTAVLKITVTPVVDITPDTDTTIAGYPVTTPVLGNDTFEGENPVVTVEGGDGPANGTVTVNPDGSITYMPNDKFVGTDTYTYTVTSGGVTETTTVTIHVTNVPPVPQADVKTVPEDTPATGNVLTNDGTPGGGGMLDGDKHPFELTEFTVEGKTYKPGETADIPGVGTITIDKDGNYRFVPVPDWNGKVPTIGYTVSDGYPGGEAKSTLDITVTPVVDAIPDHTKTESSTPVTIDPLENDKFSNPDAKITEVTQGKFGKVEITPDGKIIYTPDSGMSGTDTFTYTVTSGGVTETTTVTVEVMPDNPGEVAPGFPSSWTPAPDVRDPIRNSVVGEPSVFFYGDVFNKLPRMDVPFHPIVYVNREVQLAQQIRAWSDLRQGGGNTDYVELALLEARLVSQRVAMQHILYVQEAVGESVWQSRYFSAQVEGHPTRTHLTGDGRLPTPGLYAPVMPSLPSSVREAMRQAQEEANPSAQDQPDGDPGQAARGQTEGESDQAIAESAALSSMPSTGAAANDIVFEAAPDGAAPDGEAFDDDAQSMPVGAPSFTAQLQSGSGHLPSALRAPIDGGTV